MTLQASGAISLLDVATEFGGAVPHSMNEYYAAAAGVPTSGLISLSDFYGKSNNPFAQFYSKTLPTNFSARSVGAALGTSLTGQYCVYVAGGRVWYSSDYGDTWVQAASNVSSSSWLNACISDNGQTWVVVGTDGKIWRGITGGTGTVYPSSLNIVISSFCMSRDGLRMYYTTSNNNTTFGANTLYRYHNFSSVNFSFTGTVSLNATRLADISCNSNGSIVVALAASGTNFTDNGFYASTDFGASFAQAITFNNFYYENAHVIRVSGDGTRIFVGGITNAGNKLFSLSGTSASQLSSNANIMVLGTWGEFHPVGISNDGQIILAIDAIYGSIKYTRTGDISLSELLDGQTGTQSFTAANTIAVSGDGTFAVAVVGNVISTTRP